MGVSDGVAVFPQHVSAPVITKAPTTHETYRPMRRVLLSGDGHVVSSERDLLLDGTNSLSKVFKEPPATGQTNPNVSLSGDQDRVRCTSFTTAGSWYERALVSSLPNTCGMQRQSVQTICFILSGLGPPGARSACWRLASTNEKPIYDYR